MTNTYKPEDNTANYTITIDDNIDLSGLTASTMASVTIPSIDYTSNYTIGTIGGFNGTGYTYTNASGYSLSPNVVVNNDPSSLEVNGKIIHNGKDLEERLSTIEKVLNIPERDVKLEEKYPKLKKMYDDYIKELSKARMWESLKGDEE